MGDRRKQKRLSTLESRGKRSLFPCTEREIEKTRFFGSPHSDLLVGLESCREEKDEEKEEMGKPPFEKRLRSIEPSLTSAISLFFRVSTTKKKKKKEESILLSGHHTRNQEARG